MSTTTANMLLTVPAANDTDYPSSISSTCTAIDLHDHSTGKGVQIVTGGITDLAVTAAKLAANAVTKAKLAALGQQTSVACSLSTASAVYVDVPSMSVTITTTGRPVYVGIIPDILGFTGYIGGTNAGAGGIDATFAILEDGVIISSTTIVDPSATGTMKYPPGQVHTIRAATAGSHTYKVQIYTNSTFIPTSFAVVAGCNLIAYEL